MTVQRRLDPPRVLEGSKDAVLDMKAARDAAGGISNDICCTGHFYQPPPIAYTRPHRGRQPEVRRVTAGCSATAGEDGSRVMRDTGLPVSGSGGQYEIAGRARAKTAQWRRAHYPSVNVLQRLVEKNKEVLT